jgi:hypothetical protein
METWKDIPGYKGLYQVSDQGQVKSLKRLVKNGHGERQVKEKILKSRPNKQGHIRINLNKNGEYKEFNVHKLVQLAFLTPGIIDHINRDRADNRLVNLRVVTHRQNCLNTIRNKYLPGAQKNNSKTSPWKSQMRINGVQENLGSFKTELEAHQAYLDRLEEIGEVI